MASEDCQGEVPHFPALVQNTAALWGMTPLPVPPQTWVHPVQAKVHTLLVQAAENMSTLCPTDQSANPGNWSGGSEAPAASPGKRVSILPFEAETGMVSALLVHFLELKNRTVNDLFLKKIRY